MQVSLLKLNSGISRAVETTTTLERQNADLEASIARLSVARPDRVGRDHAGHADAARRRRRLPDRAAARMPRTPCAGCGRRARTPRRCSPTAGSCPARSRRPPRRRRWRRRRPRPRRPSRRPRRRSRPPRRPATTVPATTAAADDDHGAGGRRAGDHRACRRGTARSVGLIERRIGLLFAVFLGMLVLAGARAGWLGIVRANTLQSAAATQQKADIVVPARRGTISDANGIELAVSKPAQTIAATPYLIDEPGRGRRAARDDPAPARGRAAAQARAARHRLRLPRPPRADQARAARAEAERRGAPVHPGVQPRVPARLDGLAAARQRRHRRHRPLRAGVPPRRTPRRPRRRAPAGPRRARRHDRAARGAAHRARARTCG